MSNYYLHSVILKGCPYSNAAHELLTNISEFTFVDYNNKDKHKTSDISTFPQIYLKRKDSNGSLLIGGYDNIKEMYDLFHKKEYSETNINKFIENNKNWSKKSLLRFIELINS